MVKSLRIDMVVDGSQEEIEREDAFAEPLFVTDIAQKF